MGVMFNTYGDGAIVTLMAEVWRTRCANVAEGVAISFLEQRKSVLSDIKETLILSNGTMKNHINKLLIVIRLNVRLKHRNAARIAEVHWKAPDLGEVKANIDGSSFGDLGRGGIGVLSIDSNEGFLGCGFRGVGVVTGYMVECSDVLAAMDDGWQALWVEGDSESVIHAFSTGNIPSVLKSYFVSTSYIM